MNVTALGPLLAAVAVVMAAAPHRPQPEAVARGLRLAGGGRPDAGPRRAPASAVGGAVRRVLGRPADPAADRAVGRALLVGLVLVPIEPAFALMWAGGAAVAAGTRRRGARRRAGQQLVDELPEVVDLLALAVSTGLTVPLAVGVVAERGVGRIAASLGRSVEAATQGGVLSDALDAVVVELGDEVRPLVRVLTGALRDGTEVVPALDRLAGEVRVQRRRAAEERARRLPVQLLFPLVVCVLPAFALLTVVPLLAGALQGLPG